MKQALNLTGKAAIVTGGSRGIGKATASVLAELGCKVAIVSRKQPVCETVAAEISEVHGVETIAVGCHCGKPDQVESMVKQVAEKFGRIDILVNNAATNPHFGMAADATPELLQKILDTNVVGYYSTIRAVLPHMDKVGGGSIVNLTSVAGMSPAPFMGLYSISKAAVISLTKMFARELGPRKIRVNAVAPGLIKTDFSQALWSSEAILDEVLKTHAIQRTGEPDEAANIIAFLASDAASFITGSVCTVDGGSSI